VTPDQAGAAAGFASRTVALITDGVVFGGSQALIIWTMVQVAALLARPSFGDRLTPWIVTVGATVLAIAYSVVSWTWFGKTPGKALLGLAVVTDDGSRPGLLRSLARFGGYMLSAIPLGAGFLWILVDDNRRGWHDHIAGTWVVYTEGSRAAHRHGKGEPTAQSSG
jgi:uncharacterized RDD family membrane protein YckC